MAYSIYILSMFLTIASAAILSYKILFPSKDWSWNHFSIRAWLIVFWVALMGMLVSNYVNNSQTVRDYLDGTLF